MLRFSPGSGAPGAEGFLRAVAIWRLSSLPAKWRAGRARVFLLALSLRGCQPEGGGEQRGLAKAVSPPLTPPTFLAHAIDDTLVPPSNSKMFHDALVANKVRSKYLELPNGGHGLSGYKGPSWDAWKTQSLQWLREIGMLQEDDSEDQAAAIDAATVKKWSAPYRNWHHHPDHVIAPKPNVKGYENVGKTDVPTVFQVPGDNKWHMTFIGFDGKGYQSFIAESDDLVQWTNMRLAMGYGPKDSFDHGGVVLGAYLYEGYDIKAPRTLKQPPFPRPPIRPNGCSRGLPSEANS